MNEISSVVVRLWARKLRNAADVLERAALTIANLEDRVQSTRDSAGRVIEFINTTIAERERGHRESYRHLPRVNELSREREGLTPDDRYGSNPRRGAFGDLERTREKLEDEVQRFAREHWQKGVDR